MKLGPGLTLSWKRALGVTKAKHSTAKATGVNWFPQSGESSL